MALTTQCQHTDVGCSVQCCLTSPETVSTIRDEEPRMSTSTFTQPLTSDVVETDIIMIVSWKQLDVG